MTAELTHLSYSSISLYMNCPEAWRRRYLLKEPSPAGPALVFGSAVHGSLEQAMVEQRPPAEFWNEAWAKATEGKLVEWGADSPETVFNQGVRVLSSEPVKKLARELRPLVDDNGPYIERKVELRVPGVDVPVVGYIDLIAADGVPGDFKTAARAWPGGKAEAELQPLFYIAALNQAGYSVPGMKFRHYVITKGAKPNVEVHETERSWGEIVWLFEAVARVWQAIRAEAFPMNPSSWRCSAAYCEFWRTCRGRRLA